MKKIILVLIACCTFSTSIIAQVDTSKIIPALDNTEYKSLIKKAKTQRTVGWVLVGGGVCMGVAANLMSRKNKSTAPEGSWNNSLDDLSSIGDMAPFALIGTGAILCSIPFFVSSSRNKKRANLLLKRQQVIIAPGFKNNLDSYQIGIAVNF